MVADPHLRSLEEPAGIQLFRGRFQGLSEYSRNTGNEFAEGGELSSEWEVPEA